MRFIKYNFVLPINSNYMKRSSKAVISLEEFYKLKYCSTVVYMVPRA